MSLAGAAMAGLLLAIAAPAFATDTVTYYYNDAQGSPVAVADAAGNILESTAYAPYGATLNRPVHDGPGYTGHEEDSATGLSYMQQRYYDPQSGQFISTDPVLPDGGSGASFNRYAYASDNPYRFTDPDGRQPACAGDGSNADCGGTASETTHTQEDSCTGSHISGNGCASPTLGISGTPNAAEIKATPGQRAALSSLSYQSVRTGDDGIENKFYMNDAGQVLGKTQSGCYGGDNCTVSTSELPAGTTDLGHTHVYPETASGGLPRRDLQLTREYPGPGDASPLGLGLTSSIFMPSGARYLIEGTSSSPHISYLGGGNTAFGAFVTQTWQPGMTTEQMLDDIHAFEQSNGSQ